MTSFVSDVVSSNVPQSVDGLTLNKHKHTPRHPKSRVSQDKRTWVESEMSGVADFLRFLILVSSIPMVENAHPLLHALGKFWFLTGLK
jgi:hypothetical protein